MKQWTFYVAGNTVLSHSTDNVTFFRLRGRINQSGIMQSARSFTKHFALHQGAVHDKLSS
jgi:hypothetical protein